MENRITLQDFVDSLAQRENMAKRDAEAFLRAFFDVVEEGLIDDSFAKIKGFGTFKVVAVSERESVNVNTGERIQISGHSKVTFTPDALLRDLINKPFAHFQTVILNEDTDLDELDNVTDDEEASIKEDDVDEEVVDTTIPIEPVDELSETPVDEEAKNEQDTTCEDVGQAEKETFAPIDEENSEEKSSEVPISLDNYEVIEESTDEQTAEPVPIPVPNTVSEDKSEELETHTEAKTLAEEPVNEPEDSAADDTLADELSQGEEHIRYILREEHPTNRWKVLALILFAILLMILSYFAGYFRVLCPCELTPTPQVAAVATPPVADTLALDTVHADTVSSSSDAMKVRDEAAPASNASTPETSEIKKEKVEQPAPPAVENDVPTQPEKVKKQERPRTKYRITGTRQTYTVARGETLRGIAEHVYGHRSYYTYIVQHNGIKDPDNIAVGTKIKLPELELNAE